jgi:hypothetical protein
MLGSLSIHERAGMIACLIFSRCRNLKIFGRLRHEYKIARSFGNILDQIARRLR